MKLYGRVGGVETEIGGGGASIQVTFLPTASASLVGTIYQYVGTTSGSTINGHFYKCVEGSTSGTYEWVDTMDSTPTENSTNPVTSGGVYDALQSAGGGGLTLLHSGKVASVDISNATGYTLIILVMLYDSYGLKSIFAPSLMSGTNSYSLYATASSGNDTKLADIKCTDTSIIRFSSMSTWYTTNIYGLK